MTEEGKIDAIYEYEKLKFEIEYTASQILTSYSSLVDLKNNFNIMKLRMPEWERRAAEIHKAN
ncbi:hypothetical protein [Burkholderia gladioli]|uniref:hypothetical protein n=1 Tax=Burkholderia gladioli TaxID=28095 RepID=UPI00163E43D6|nr:hypothetical protein [Burkholderia gladioli]